MKDLYLAECFYSFQGEGKRAGMPSVFIRFTGCNMQCQGFGVKYNDPKTGEVKYGCDSYYAVDKNFKNQWTKIDCFEKLKNSIENVMPKINQNNLSKPDIVITGGEPLLHWKNKMFQNLLAYYINRGHMITIETNATIDIKFKHNYQKEIMFSMSPKLDISGEKEKIRINPICINSILENAKKSYLKFVVNGKKAIDEIHLLLKEIPIYADQVCLMPLGNAATLEKNALLVSSLALENGFMYSDRLHIRLHGDKQGI